MSEDLGLFFDAADGFAEPVTVGAVQTSALFDTSTELLVGEVLQIAPSLRLPAAAVPAVGEGTVCVVRGQSYRVRQVRQEPPDGVLLRLVLGKG